MSAIATHCIGYYIRQQKCEVDYTDIQSKSDTQQKHHTPKVFKEIDTLYYLNYRCYTPVYMCTQGWVILIFYVLMRVVQALVLVLVLVLVI